MAHVTAMPVPVADSTAEGVVPLAAAVAGHGSSVGTKTSWNNEIEEEDTRV